MCQHDTAIKQDFIKSETEYLAYMRAFLHFLSCYLLELRKEGTSAKQQQRIEKQMLSSLLTLEKLQQHLTLRKNLLDPLFESADEAFCISWTQDDHTPELGDRLLIMKERLENHRFHSQQAKHQCLIILRHLINQYNIIPVINQSPPVLPWIAQPVPCKFLEEGEQNI